MLFLTQNEVCRLVPQEINRCLTYGGRYIFMTHILQLASKLCYAGFILSRFNIIKYESVSSFWSRLVLPLTSTVCLMYYILYTINPDLVRNPQAVQFIPAKLEFILHLAILPAAVLESIVGDHEIKVGETMKMMSLFMVSYSLWSLYCFFQSGLWPYSVINKVGVVPSVVIFVPFCLLLSLIGTMTVKKIQTLPIFSHTLNNNIRLTVSASNKKSS